MTANLLHLIAAPFLSIKRTPTIKTWAGLSLVIVALILSGCSKALVVSGVFPKPLVQPMALSASAFYSSELRQHSYIEASKDRRKWTIQTGQAQYDFFETLLPALFENWQIIQQDPRAAGESAFNISDDIDLVIRPDLKDFQYSLPTESRSKVFEVWMKYNMQVFKSDGELLADWYISAYGKTPSAFMQSDTDAMNAAVVVALRDLGANLSINFKQVPELKSWLEHNQ